MCLLLQNELEYFKEAIENDYTVPRGLNFNSVRQLLISCHSFSQNGKRGNADSEKCIIFQDFCSLKKSSYHNI